MMIAGIVLLFTAVALAVGAAVSDEVGRKRADYFTASRWHNLSDSLWLAGVWSGGVALALMIVALAGRP